jgi:hypothetical protein
MNDTWGHTLRMLQPDIDVLKEFMDQGPRIKPMLKFVKRTWVLEINIDWGMFEIQYGNPWIAEPLDTKVLWATQQLENWENVSRQAWNMWHFKHKRDAEKFITLYNLKWGK